MAIIIKTAAEIRVMREAGRITARALDAIRNAAHAGVATADLDALAEDIIRTHNAVPAFLGYPNPSYPGHPYPATINASINDELVHGIPGDRVLQEGDILSVDCGCVYQGFVGDAAFTMPIGVVAVEADKLIHVTAEALYKAIAASRVGQRIGDVSATIEEYVTQNGYTVVREYTGHGVGRRMHEDPTIPNWGRRKTGALIRAGMTYALEPMVIVGDPEVYVERDHWTVVTKDHSLCAHFEHTIAITDGEPEILTLL